MFGRYHTFSFELDKKAIKHLKEKSHYNHNYYELDLSAYGDYITPAACDILLVEYDEFSETYTCTLGYFEGVDFVRCFTWTETKHINLDIIIE
jgi:hypothetical protein